MAKLPGKTLEQLRRRDRRIAWAEWILILLIIAVDAVLDHTSGIPVGVSMPNIKALLVIFMLWPLIALLTRKLNFAVGSEVLAENTAKFLIFISAGSILEYYCAMSPMPEGDNRLMAFDQMLGFDWPSFYAWVIARPAVFKVLHFCYYGLLPETGFVLLVVSIFYPRRAGRFATALVISALLCMVFLFIMPVAGPFVRFRHADLPAANYTEHYMAMHNRTMAAIPMEDIRGIISFPSFHVMSAVIMTFFLRGLPVFFWSAILLNIGMAVGALVIGGHYLADVLAGVLTGMLTVFILAWLEQGYPEERLPLFRKSKKK